MPGLIHIPFLLSNKSVPVVEVIKVTMTPTAGFTAGITLGFASGTFSIDWKDGTVENFTSDVELTHTYTSAGTYVAEISGNLSNITKFIANDCKITFIENFKSGLLTVFEIQSNLYVGVLDMSNAPIKGTFNAAYNAGLITINFAELGNEIVFNFQCDHCDALTELNLSNVPVQSYIKIDVNANLKTVIVADSGNETLSLNFNAKECTLDYFYIGGGINMNANDSKLYLYNNLMTAAEVNHFLVDRDAIEVSGYTGRIINIGGNNASPDSSSGGYDGLAAKASLESKGFTVTV